MAGSAARFQCASTAAASYGVPSENLRFGRSLSVHSVKSWFAVIDSARPGCSSPEGSW
jgi:hypothetical protein